MISERDVAFYRAEGYLVVPDVFDPPTLEGLRREIIQPRAQVVELILGLDLELGPLEERDDAVGLVLGRYRRPRGRLVGPGAGERGREQPDDRRGCAVGVRDTKGLAKRGRSWPIS